jgi:Protein of unknown function (DUF3301)
MYFDLSDVAVLSLFITAAVFWWQGYAVKELALKATKAHCAAVGVQLLDESVALRGFWIRRDTSGNLCLRRSFLFEFTTTGEQRYHGCTLMLGRRLESVQLAPHRLN